MQIATDALPVGALQSPYSATLVATDGVPPYSWSQTGGQLPVGLTLNLAGTITGRPTAAGTFAFTTKVQDSTATSLSTGFSLNVSPAPAPMISAVSPGVGSIEGGSFVTVGGSNFSSGAIVQFGGLPAQSVRVVNSTEIQVVTPAEPGSAVNVTVQGPDGQVATAERAFTFIAPAATGTNEATPNADVVVDASQTLSETGRDDLAAAKNIYASASTPESNGGLSIDWNLTSSELTMKRLRDNNGLYDCALDSNGNLTGCVRLDSDLSEMKLHNLTPHIVVGQGAPASIAGNPLQWGPAQWAQYDALCYAIVNHVANQYGGTGFSEALFEVENELDSTLSAADLWLTPTPNVPQGDKSRFAQFDTLYSHWAKAVSLVAQQNPDKKIRIAGPSTGFWTVYYGSGQLWHNQIIRKYAAQGLRLDIVTLHIYEFEANDLAKYAQSIRNTLVASGYPNAEIWVTEWGASDQVDSYFGGINGSHQGAAWAINFLLQGLKGTVTGGSFLAVRDNQGSDFAGVNANMYSASWNHVENSLEYPKAITNALSMVDRMMGTRKSASVNVAKPDLHALASSDAASASLIVCNYNYLFDSANKKYSDLTTDQTVTVGFKNLPFSGPVTVDRYVIDSQTSNLNHWTAAGKSPPSLQATQLQRVESFPARSLGGTLVLPSRQLGQSAVSLWIVHQ